MVEVEADLKEQKVVIIKADGFKKFGTVKALQDGLLLLEYNDGKREYIPLATIQSIQKDAQVR